MTAVDRGTLKTYFETGDRPTQTQFTNLIDSPLVISASEQPALHSSVSLQAASTVTLTQTGSVIKFDAVGGYRLAASLQTELTTVACFQAGNNVALAQTGSIIKVTSASLNIGTATGTADFWTASTVLEDVTGMTVTLTTTGKNCLVLWSGPAKMPAGGQQALWDYNLDGTDTGGIKAVATATDHTTITAFYLYTGVSAAAHTFKLRMRTSGGGTGSMNMSSVMNGTFMVIEVI